MRRSVEAFLGTHRLLPAFQQAPLCLLTRQASSRSLTNNTFDAPILSSTPHFKPKHVQSVPFSDSIFTSVQTVDRGPACRTLQRRPPQRPAPRQRARSVCSCRHNIPGVYALAYRLGDRRAISLIGRALRGDGYRDAPSLSDARNRTSLSERSSDDAAQDSARARRTPFKAWTS